MAGSKKIQAIILFKDELIPCSVSKGVTGATLLTHVCTRVGTYEPWWFGLEYVDSNGITLWLKLSKKIITHDISKDESKRLKLTLKIKHFPKNVQTEVIQTKTAELFYDIAREQIINEEMYADPGTVSVLAGVHLQYLYGDLAGSPAGIRMIEDNFYQLVPKGLLERYTITDSEWRDTINDFWLSANTLSKDEAVKQGMGIIQCLRMYGVDYYEIKNIRNLELLLGVTSEGLNIYKVDNKLKPKVILKWQDIKSLSYRDRRFTIKRHQQDLPDIVIFFSHNKKNVNVMDLCIERYQMYKDRNVGDNKEIKEWKSKAQLEENKINARIDEHKKNIQVKNNYQVNLRKVQRAIVNKEQDEEIELTMIKAYEDALIIMHNKVQEVEAENARLQFEAKRAEEALETLLLQNKGKSVKLTEEEEKKNTIMAEEYAKVILLAQQKQEEAERLKRELEAFKETYEEDRKRLKQLEEDIAAGKEVIIPENDDDILESSVANANMLRKADEYGNKIKKHRNIATQEDINDEDTHSIDSTETDLVSLLAVSEKSSVKNKKLSSVKSNETNLTVSSKETLKNMASTEFFDDEKIIQRESTKFVPSLESVHHSSISSNSSVSDIKVEVPQETKVDDEEPVLDMKDEKTEVVEPEKVEEPKIVKEPKIVEEPKKVEEESTESTEAKDTSLKDVGIVAGAAAAILYALKWIIF